MLNQQDGWALAKVAESEIHIVRIGNIKKLWIDLGGEAYKGRMTDSELDCNIYEKWSG